MSLRVHVRNRIARSRRRSIFVVPFLLTFGNALCGFLSIIRSVEGDVLGAAYCIMLAALLDMLDGRAARAFGACSYLGMELDSLCDAISFCLAPLVAVYCWHDGATAPFFMSLLAFYLCAGLFRLAKFNVLSAQKTPYFLGLPTTLSALLIAHIILYEPFFAGLLGQVCLPAHIVAGIIGVLSVLMISTIRFSSGKYIHFSLRAKGALFFVGICIFLGLILDVPVSLAALAFYIVASVAMHIGHAIVNIKQVTDSTL